MNNEKHSLQSWDRVQMSCLQWAASRVSILELKTGWFDEVFLPVFLSYPSCYVDCWRRSVESHSQPPSSSIQNPGSRIQSRTFLYTITASYIKVAAVIPCKNGSNDYGEQNMHELWLSRVRKLARPCTNSTSFLPSLFPLVADHLLLITTCYKYLYILAIQKYQVQKSRTWNLPSPKGVASSSNDLRFILVDGS